MPIDRFWLIEKNISRIEAYQTMQRLDVNVASQHKDSYRDMHENLKRIIGVVAMDTPKLDKKGLQGLKGLQQGTE